MLLQSSSVEITLTPPQGTSAPFEVKGGSPIVLEVTLPQGKYEIRIMPVVMEVRHLADVVNLSDPMLPTLAIQTQMQMATRKL